MLLLEHDTNFAHKEYVVCSSLGHRSYVFVAYRMLNIKIDGLGRGVTLT